jgi:hypothetical protein
LDQQRIRFAEQGARLRSNDGVFGYYWEKSEFSTRRQAADRDVVKTPSVVLSDLTEDPDSDACPVAAPSHRATPLRPIYDPLAGPDPGQRPMSFFDFIVWDIARAYQFLQLPNTIHMITEEMVERTELFMQCLLDESFKMVIDPKAFTDVMNQKGSKA